MFKRRYYGIITVVIDKGEAKLYKTEVKAKTMPEDKCTLSPDGRSWCDVSFFKSKTERDNFYTYNI